ncbi:hypothetical protein HBB16_06330 [Pseudonocardia sp. MCCB 268]|nr:hypothetical protein [Pseudonocardia cytotoxica]
MCGGGHHLLPEALATLQSPGTTVERTRSLVNDSCKKSTTGDVRHGELLADQRAGKTLRISPETADRRARGAGAPTRTPAGRTGPKPTCSRASGGGRFGSSALRGRLTVYRTARVPGVEHYITDTRRSEPGAVAAVVEVERRLGRDPEVMAHNNPGYDYSLPAPPTAISCT